MTRAETSALRTLVTSGTVFANVGKLFTGIAVADDGTPITGTWYAVLQPGEDTDSQDRLAGPYASREPSFTFQCVHTSPDGAAWVADQLDAVLRPSAAGLIVPAPGRHTFPIRRTYVGNIQKDTDAPSVMWFQTVEYSFRSDPA